MGASTNAELIDLVRKNIAFADSAAEELLAEEFFGIETTTEVFFKTAADAMAADTTLLWALPIDRKIQVTSVTIMRHGALTAHDTNYATVSLEVDDGAGGSDTQIAAKATTVANGNWVAGTAHDLTMHATAANHFVDGKTARKWLIFKIAKAASGVAVPSCKMFVTYRLSA